MSTVFGNCFDKKLPYFRTKLSELFVIKFFKIVRRIYIPQKPITQNINFQSMIARAKIICEFFKSVGPVAEDIERGLGLMGKLRHDRPALFYTV